MENHPTPVYNRQTLFNSVLVHRYLQCCTSMTPPMHGLTSSFRMQALDICYVICTYSAFQEDGHTFREDS